MPRLYRHFNSQLGPFPHYPFLNGKLIDFPHVDLVDRPPCVAAPEAPPRRPPAPGFPSITKR